MSKFNRKEACPVAQGLFELADAKKPESYPPEFIHNFQRALLLSLLERGLLTQGQFERCAEELQRRLG